MDFHIRNWPPEYHLVALITGNFDDSRAGDDVWVVAGYVGYKNQWDYFEELWRAALDRHGVPYFHMREMAKPNGAFAKWSPPEEHAAEVVEYFKDLVSAILNSGLHKISAAVWLDDLAKFNRDTGLSLEAYPLAAYTCISLAAVRYDLQPLTAVFDRVEKVEAKLKIARSYAASDRQFPGLCDSVAMVPLQKSLTARDVPGLQAADLIAWEIRKAQFNMKGWQKAPERSEASEDRNLQWERYLEWVRATTGADPVLRKSLDALISTTAVNAVRWDTQQLNHTHRARGGVWFVHNME